MNTVYAKLPFNIKHPSCSASWASLGSILATVGTELNADIVLGYMQAHSTGVPATDTGGLFGH
jgi:hypothetical protein